MSIVEKQHRFLYLILFATFTAFGTSMTIVGATLPRILSDFNWGYTMAGAVLAAGAIGYFTGTFLFGKLIKRIGLRLNILIGVTLNVMGLLFFASTPSAAINFFLNLAIGLGQGAIELTVNMAILKMDKKGTGKAMSLMHAAFAIGAVAGPIVIGLLLHAGLVWTLVYRGIAILFVLIGVLLALSPFSLLGSFEAETKKGSKESLFLKPIYWLGFLTLLLYVGMELGISSWVAEYFVKVFGSNPATGSFMVSLFWGGILAGRLGMPVFYSGKNPRPLLVIFASLALVSVAIISVTGYFPGAGILAAYAAVALSGLGCSIIYPTVVTLIGEALPNAQSEAIGFATTGGGIGAFAFPFMMSALADSFGIQAGFTVYAFFGLLTLVSCILLAVSSKKRKLA